MLPEEHASKAGSIGRRGALHTELRMTDKDGKEVIGEGTGQIQIRTEGMMLGYWNKPEATAECLHSDGWLDSGDLARRDAGGYYWVLGRAKELIRLTRPMPILVWGSGQKVPKSKTKSAQVPPKSAQVP